MADKNFKITNKGRCPVVLPSKHVLGSALDAKIIGARPPSVTLTSEEMELCKANPGIASLLASDVLIAVAA